MQNYMRENKLRNFKMYIAGKWVDADSGKTYKVVNPATGEEFAAVPLGGKAEVDNAVKAAREAFLIWSQTPLAERSRIVAQISQGILERADEFAYLDVVDHGTPINAARGMVQAVAPSFENTAQLSRSLSDEAIPFGPQALVNFEREPIGVCALITPWNAPLAMIANKLAPALIMGNTCIVKPPSIDSLTTLLLGEVLEKLNLPPGTVNIVTGPGSLVGEALASHPGVDKVSFTGSCETGKVIMACAAGNVKRVSLELGGKNPFIVLEDADIEATVDGAVFAQFMNSGMICASPGRYYVHENIHDKFVQKFARAASKLKVGDPMSNTTQLGPVVSAEHRDKIEAYIRSGIEEGAMLVLGGKRPTEPPLDKGYFVMPTIFTNVNQKMRIAREEIFGPVASIIKFSSEDEVIGLANDSNYGLSASVWTKNISKGVKFARAIQAGIVWVNDHMVMEGLPFGGVKESGFGKEGSIHCLDEYSQKKVIFIDQTGSKQKPWHRL